ncbi:MAG: amidohydrolase, partial [Acidobacteriota bacterium]|nr:amidohydrolase [Acidobacteriota bacterium]
MKKTLSLCLILVTLGLVCAQEERQRGPTLSQEVRDFVSVDAPVIALTHARVIDGTGAKALQDQTVIISDAHIQSI